MEKEDGGGGGGEQDRKERVPRWSRFGHTFWYVDDGWREEVAKVAKVHAVSLLCNGTRGKSAVCLTLIRPN